MFQDKIMLTQHDILEKKFKIDTRGYRMQEVDKFLDQIICDYGEFYKEIESKTNEIARLNDELLRAKQELRNARSNIEIAKQGEKEITNVDLLKRVSRIEEMIFGNRNHHGDNN